jgi:hypothetical protein
MSANLSAADALIGGRIVARTKLRYESKIRAIAKFYKVHLDPPRGRRFTVPVDRDDILAFFGWLIDVEHKDRPLAISSVHLYKSALGWYYKKRKLIIDPAVNQELDTLLNGIPSQSVRVQAGTQDALFEGKYHRPFAGYRTLANILFRSAPFNQILFAWPCSLRFVCLHEMVMWASTIS